MKKLEKLTLKELGSELNFIGVVEAQRLNGGYDNDCFWRCVAYLQSGGASYTEASAEILALSYFGSDCGDYLSANGAGVTSPDIATNATNLAIDGNYHLNPSGAYIGMFNTNNISSYNATGMAHAVIVQCVNEDGSLEIFDPQDGSYTIIPSEEANYVSRAMY